MHPHADLPEITDSFQLSWSLKYSSRRQFSLFSSDSFLPSDSPAGSFSVLDVRDRRPSRRRFRDERPSFAWKLQSEDHECRMKLDFTVQLQTLKSKHSVINQR